MKRGLLILLLSFGFCGYAGAQNPLVKQWDKRFGGDGLDRLNCFQKTKDNGYILGGRSYSNISGDKTENSWVNSFDYWIVKIDSLGNYQWDKDFGGANYDLLYSIQETTDGGYILGGYSNSNNSGDKTQSKWGGWDYWIVKTDSFGNYQWDKDFGGTADDLLYSIRQAKDGGYILGGYSNSNISGNKTDSLRGTLGYADYWIVKTDSLGNYQWDKDFGGSYAEELFSLELTLDGGYILG